MAAVLTEGSGGGRASTATWRKQVMVGELPPDFLRIMITPQQVTLSFRLFRLGVLEN